MSDAPLTRSVTTRVHSIFDASVAFYCSMRSWALLALTVVAIAAAAQAFNGKTVNSLGGGMFRTVLPFSSVLLDNFTDENALLLL